MFFNVRELKKLINDVMRPLGCPGRKRGAARSQVSGERFAKPRIFINRETAVGTLCFPNDGPLVWKILYDVQAWRCDSFFFFLSFVKIVTVA